MNRVLEASMEDRGKSWEGESSSGSEVDPEDLMTEEEKGEGER